MNFNKRGNRKQIIEATIFVDNCENFCCGWQPSFESRLPIQDFFSKHFFTQQMTVSKVGSDIGWVENLK